jgi:hypothetical protein
MKTYKLAVITLFLTALTGCYINDEVKHSYISDIGSARQTEYPQTSQPPVQPRNNTVEQSFAVEAGPIWDNEDAKMKCPGVCSQNSAMWNGHWWTTVENEMSVCNCVRQAEPNFDSY